MLLYLLFFQVMIYAQVPLPDGFVYLEELIPNLQYDLKYHSEDNFIGKCIHGYYGDRIIVTKKAAKQLVKVQRKLNESGLTLFVFDAYRPQRAVDQFVSWAKNLNDTLNKSKYYPEVDKNRLFKEGYISSHSRHSSGSTIDLSIAYMNGELLDMGGIYDFFGERSHVDYIEISEQQMKNRNILQSIMKQYGFRNYSQEWWHFTLRGEPYRDQHFDFDVY